MTEGTNPGDRFQTWTGETVTAAGTARVRRNAQGREVITMDITKKAPDANDLKLYQLTESQSRLWWFTYGAVQCEARKRDKRLGLDGARGTTQRLPTAIGRLGLSDCSLNQMRNMLAYLELDAAMFYIGAASSQADA